MDGEINIIEVGDEVPLAAANQDNQKKRKLKADAHDHFTLIEEDNKFKCNYCSVTYNKSTGGVTSNMARHIKSTHPNLMSIDNNSSIKRYLVTEKNIKPVPVFSAENFRKALVDLIILTDQPFSFVEEETFQQIIKMCNPEVKFPGRTTVRSDVLKLYNTEKLDLKKQLKDIPGKLSFALDGWTSSNQHPFLGVTVQGVTVDWKIFTTPLDLVLLEGEHTRKNIAHAFIRVLEDFELLEKVYSITSDNASNMDTFCDHFQKLMEKKGLIFDVQNFRVRCLAHILNLCCQDSLAVLKDDPGADYEENSDGTHVAAITKLRKCIVFIRASPQRMIQFRNQCTAANWDELQLILDVPTRWNSTLDLLTRAFKLREPLACTLQSEKTLLSWILCDDDWTKVEYMIDFLEIFKEMTELMSVQRFPTISFCSLVYSQVFEHLEKYMVDKSRNLKAIDPRSGKVYAEWIQEAAKKAHAKLDKYYPCSDGLVYVLGTVLDPRCKTEIFQSAGFSKTVINQYVKNITQYWKKHYKPEPDIISVEENKPTSTTNRDLFLTMKRKHPKSNKDELERYLAEPTVNQEALKEGALEWWKAREFDFPNLSKMAKDCLTASGAAVSVERLFSTCSDLLGPRRQSLNPESIRACICTKGWLRAKEQTTLQSNICKAISEKMLGNC